jgi:hypothetical protein
MDTKPCSQCSGCQYVVLCLGSWPTDLRFFLCTMCDNLYWTQGPLASGINYAANNPETIPRTCRRWIQGSFRCILCEEYIRTKQQEARESPVVVYKHWVSDNTGGT